MFICQIEFIALLISVLQNSQGQVYYTVALNAKQWDLPWSGFCILLVGVPEITVSSFHY